METAFECHLSQTQQWTPLNWTERPWTVGIRAYRRL